jgi:hypothetical protein
MTRSAKKRYAEVRNKKWKDSFDPSFDAAAIYSSELRRLRKLPRQCAFETGRDNLIWSVSQWASYEGNRNDILTHAKVVAERYVGANILELEEYEFPSGARVYLTRRDEIQEVFNVDGYLEDKAWKYVLRRRDGMQTRYSVLLKGFSAVFNRLPGQPDCVQDVFDDLEGMPVQECPPAHVVEAISSDWCDDFDRRMSVKQIVEISFPENVPCMSVESVFSRVVDAHVVFDEPRRRLARPMCANKFFSLTGEYKFWYDGVPEYVSHEFKDAYSSQYRTVLTVNYAKANDTPDGWRKVKVFSSSGETMLTNWKAAREEYTDIYLGQSYETVFKKTNLYQGLGFYHGKRIKRKRSTQ